MIYTSDLSRASETAKIIAARQPGKVPVVAMPELRECDYGLWEGLTRSEVAVRFAEDWKIWNKGGRIGSPTGGEDSLSLAGRAGRAFDAAVQGRKNGSDLHPPRSRSGRSSVMPWDSNRHSGIASR